MKTIISLIIFILLLSSFSSAGINDIKSFTDIELKLHCFSNDITVTRHFHIPNYNNSILDLKENYYTFGVNKILNSQLIKSIDNNQIDRSNQFYYYNDDAFNYYILDISNTKIPPFNEFYLITAYEVKDYVKKIDGKKQFTFETIMLDNRIRKINLILPECFLFKRSYNPIISKPANEDYLDGQLILSYDKSLLDESMSQNTLNYYKPGVAFSYSFKWSYVFFTIVIIAIGRYLIVKLLKKHIDNVMVNIEKLFKRIHK
ncbi:MAG: hypothetical protein AABX00_07005 [Nanoarchaeota archaeon]